MDNNLLNLWPQVAWSDFNQQLRGFLGEFDSCTPGSLVAAAKRAGKCVFRGSEMDSIGPGIPSFQRLVEVLEATDYFIVVTDYSFPSGSNPFVVNVSAIDAFARWHRETTGEDVVSGNDVIFFAPDSRAVGNSRSRRPLVSSDE